MKDVILCMGEFCFRRIKAHIDVEGGMEGI
jgi:hypothetical protein